MPQPLRYIDQSTWTWDAGWWTARLARCGHVVRTRVGKAKRLQEQGETARVRCERCGEQEVAA